MFSDRNHTCCFTGHRIIEERHLLLLPGLLEAALRELIADGYYTFAAGGALGFDTLAAETVLSLQREFSHLRLIVVAPFAGQPDGWSRADALRYERIPGGVLRFYLAWGPPTPGTACAGATSRWWR